MPSAVAPSEPSDRNAQIMTQSAVRRLFKRCRKEEQRLLGRLTRAAAEAHAAMANERQAKAARCRAEGIQTKYLRAFEVKLTMLDRANTRTHRSHQRSRHELVDMARTLDLFSPISEEIRLKVHLKSSGGDREIQSFGCLRRGAQMMVDAALRAFAPGRLDGRQATIPTAGREAGVSAAVRRMKSLIERGGKWAQELDVHRAYPSVTRELLVRSGEHTDCQTGGEQGSTAGIPLPRRVIDNVVLAEQEGIRPIPTANIRYPYGTHFGPMCAVIKARRGIAQGSHCSAIVWEFVVSNLLSKIKDVKSVVTFADNIFVAQTTKKNLQLVTKALTHVFSANSAGTITLQARQNATRFADGIDMLGYRLVRKGGQTIVRPNRKSIVKLHTSLQSIAKRHADRQIVPVAPFLGKVRNWAQGYPEWGQDNAIVWPYIFGATAIEALTDFSSGPVVARAILANRPQLPRHRSDGSASA